MESLYNDVSKYGKSTFSLEGVVILLVNLNVQAVRDYFGGRFILFTGMFDDFNPLWYNNIGVTILLSMIINILSTHSQSVTFFLIKLFQRFLDSGCGCDGKKTKKISRRQYYNLYIGNQFDIGVRYSQVYSFILSHLELIYHIRWDIILLRHAFNVCCHIPLFVRGFLD